MNDTQWHDRLADLAEHEGAPDFDVRDDLARGRARVRRTRVGAAAGSVMAAGLVGGIVLLGGATSGPDAAGPAATASPQPTVTDALDPTGSPSPEFSQSVEPSPTQATPRLGRQERAIARILQDTPQDRPLTRFDGWRQELFATTRSVLDPGGAHLNYSTNSMRSAWSPTGVSLGITMGWKVAGSDGEGMVQVEVVSDARSDSAVCGEAGFSCPRRVVVDGAETRLGRTPRNGLVVLQRRADGRRVLVVVDRLFGGNSLGGVPSVDVTRQDVYRLVRDKRVDLPDLR